MAGYHSFITPLYVGRWTATAFPHAQLNMLNTIITQEKLPRADTYYFPYRSISE